MNYIAITIDTECDKGAGWQVQQPLSYKNIHEGVAKYLQPLFEKYGVKPTYMLSPEIIRDKECAQYFSSLGEKAELGTHLHGEFIEPEANYNTSETSDFQSEYSFFIEREKLKNLTNLFEDTFHFKPKSFRAGRFGISKNTLPILQELGYSVDSSITPDTWWMRSKTHGVNFLGAPYQPYHPAENNFRKKGDMDILEVPVTTINSRLTNIPLTIKRALNPTVKWQRILISKLFNPKQNLHWLRPTYSTAEEMCDIMNIYQNINAQLTAYSYFTMMFHSNEFTINTSPYSLSNNKLNFVRNNLEDLLKATKDQFKFVTLSSLLDDHK